MAGFELLKYIFNDGRTIGAILSLCLATTSIGRCLALLTNSGGIDPFAAISART